MASSDRSRSLRAAPWLLLILLLPACATYKLDQARTEFYRGNTAESARLLSELQPEGRDRVLLLAERGTVRQSAGDYANSAKDFILAHDELEAMTAVKVGQDTSSMVINDSVQNYRGTPYERTLLHAFAATDHLALSDWESAAVEARRILISLDPGARGDYPDVAYARYMAGLCLQLIDDDSNAALQFRKAAEVATAVPIDDRTGRLGPEAAQSGTWPAELVCFVQIGATPRGDTTWKDRGTPEKTMYAEIVHDGKVLGRSYNLSDTVELGFTTAQKQAVKKAVKSAARIAAKETIAYQVGHDNALMGELVRLVLIGLLEQPDTRRWETMPRWLQVARVPCPPDLKSFDVIFKTSSGVTTRTVTVTQPLGRRRNTFVSFCRDLPVYTGPARDLQPKIPAAPPVPAAPSTPTAPN